MKPKVVNLLVKSSFLIPTLFALLFFSLLDSSATFGAEIDTVIDAIRSNRSTTKSIRYEINGTVTVPKGAYSMFLAASGDSSTVPEELPRSDLTVQLNAKYVIDFDGGKVSSTRTALAVDPAQSSLHTLERRNVYDGSNNIVRDSVDSSKVDPTVTKLKMHDLDGIDYLAFFGHGYLLNDGTFSLTPLDQLLASGNVQLRPESTDSNGIRYQIAELHADKDRKFHRLWINEKTGAIDRWEHGIRTPERLMFTADLQYEPRDGSQVLASFNVTQFNPVDNSPLQISQWDVSLVEVNTVLSPEEFVITPNVGDFVRDATVSEPRSIQVARARPSWMIWVTILGVIIVLSAVARVTVNRVRGAI